MGGLPRQPHWTWLASPLYPLLLCHRHTVTHVTGLIHTLPHRRIDMTRPPTLGIETDSAEAIHAARWLACRRTVLTLLAPSSRKPII